MKLTISRKLLLGYLGMAFLTLIASAYAVYSFHNLNSLAYTIIEQDFVIVETSKTLMDSLLARESAEKKYLILKDNSLADIFWTRSKEFATKLDDLKQYRSSGMSNTFSKVATLNKQYDDIFQKEMGLIRDNQVLDAMLLSDGDSKKAVEEMTSQLKAIQKKAEQNIDSRMNMINTSGVKASRLTITLSLVSLIGGLALAVLITYNISVPLKKLEKATGLIADGQFDHDFKLDRKDEIGRLANAFTVMAERLKVLEALNLDASPLTGLPGNLAIEKELEKRLTLKVPFSLCHIDLDNFKPFADKYGYAWGSEVIKEVANILTNHLGVNGHDDVFIGHIGGDDFVIIAEPELTEKMCQKLVNDFSRHIESFYSEQDRQKGHIIGKDRNGQQQTFPLITVTASVVTDDGSRFKNPLSMAKKAAELKTYGKTLPGSNYVKREDLDRVS
jgi:diguanylate cyclase (GGDEF)-like protein